MKEIYKKIYEYSNKNDILTQERWNNLFLLVCNIIDDLGSYKEKNIKYILKLLNEYDFEKNREVNNESNNMFS